MVAGRSLIVLSSLLAVVYVWRFVEAAYFREPREDLPARRRSAAGDAASRAAAGRRHRLLRPRHARSPSARRRRPRRMLMGGLR